MERRRLLVLGAGITGLTAAYEARRQAARRGVDLKVQVLESGRRPGGKVRTERRLEVDCEAGPDSFVTSKPDALELVEELGLRSELLGTDPACKTVCVFSGGRLRPLPAGMKLVLPSQILPFVFSDLLSWKAKLRMAAEPLMATGCGDEDESLASFFRRRLGAEAVEKLVAPMLAGIYASDAEEMSLKSTFPQFIEMERRGGLLRGLRSREKAVAPASEKSLFMTLKGGLSRLTDALAVALPPGTILYGHAVRSIGESGGSWRVEAGEGAFEADAVICSLPANAAAPLMKEIDSELAAVLGEIPFSSTATVSLAYETQAVPKKIRGHGFLVAKNEGRRITAATFVSSKFPGRLPENVFLIRCFLGGAGRPDPTVVDDESLAKTAAEELDFILDWGRLRPLWSVVSKWPRANPQYTVGHARRLERISRRLKGLPGLILAGASYRGIGLPDCIRSGRQAAAQALQAPAGACAGIC